MTHSIARLAATTSLAVGLTVSGGVAAQDQAPLQVLATVGMIGDVAQQVAGDCAEVDVLLGPGTDPHYYEATPRAVRALESAELIFYVHPALEERMARVLENFSRRIPTVSLVDATYDQGELLEEEPGVIDPHLWMDVARWSQIAPVIADAIAEQRPGCLDDLEANVVAYQAELSALHEWVEASIGSIPESQRMLVTAHDAFYYYGDAYNITASEAIEGISTEGEASIGDIRSVARFVVDNQVPAVFVETTINPRTIESMVAEANSMGHDVRIGGELYSDALGDADTAEGTYIGMIRSNTEQITHALGGTVAEWPSELEGWAQTWNK